MPGFNRICGNEKIIKSLQNSIQNKAVSQAYIFDGADGLGKSLMAESFAKALQCEAGGLDACNQCLSCLAFEGRNHQDIYYVSPTKTKAISVDDIREQIHDIIHIKPYKYPYKIFIIKNADTMTVSAQNAFLKTLEEPPRYGIFLMTSEQSASFLPTVLSRSIVLKHKPLSAQQVYHYLLSEQKLPSEEAEYASALCGGNIGQAISSLNEENRLLHSKVQEIATGLSHCDIPGVFSLVNDLEPLKDRIQEALDILCIWFRDLLVSKIVEPQKRLGDQRAQSGLPFQEDMADAWQLLRNKDFLSHAENYTEKRLINALEALYRAKKLLRSNVNFRLTLECCFLKIISRS